MLGSTRAVFFEDPGLIRTAHGALRRCIRQQTLFRRSQRSPGLYMGRSAVSCGGAFTGRHTTHDARRRQRVTQAA